MNSSEIQDALSAEIVARDCFIVDIKISADNDIELTIESETGTVTLDDCVEISRAFETAFDREKEDYSLTVTSAGLDKPFKVLKQFLKAIGTSVEVSLKNGKKLKGTLLAASDSHISLRYEVLAIPEGKKKKEKLSIENDFAMTEINAVRPYIDFK